MTRRLSADEFVAEVEWLIDGGLHAVHVAHAMHSTVHAIQRRMERAGRHDLARPFRNELRHGRKAA